MLARSFRLVSARLIPRPGYGKQALLLVSCILAGCGGGGQPKSSAVRVAGHGFSFTAPSGWKVQRADGRAAATRGPELVQVVTFRLERPYHDGLFRKVEPELAARMRAVAQQSGGSVAGSGAVTVAGIRAHTYRVDGGSHVDEYTFVLRGRSEYQLLCRRRASGSDAACRQLVTSFRLL